MVIDLEPPFKGRWKTGYVSVNNQGRKIIALYNGSNDRLTMSYARYLLSVKMGHRIDPEYDVDHIDNCPSNDSLDNLQLLTRKQNIEKDFFRRSSKYSGCALTCDHCGIEYHLTPKQQAAKVYNKTILNFCSPSCSAKYHLAINPPANKLEITPFIKPVQELRKKGMSIRKIASELGISKHAVTLVK